MINFSLPELGRCLQDLFFPPLCLHCHHIFEEQTELPGICQACIGFLIPMGEDLPETLILKRLKPCYLDELFIAFQFNELLRTLIHALKYQKMPRLGMQLGSLAARQLSDCLGELSDYWVIPIPLHPIRQKEREYNQSLQIARGMFAGQPEKLRDHLMVRGRYTTTQTTLNRRERRNNVRNAFTVAGKELVKDATVILVDDVTTTGATMNECARLLKRDGAGKIIGITLASPLKDFEAPSSYSTLSSSSSNNCFS